MEYLIHPLAIGLEIGLVLTVLVWFLAWGKRRGLVKENHKLKEHLNTQMEITAQGNVTLKKELEELRKQNENLRITNATLNHKTGKAELRMLTVYDRALHLMYEQAPGFAPAWERALKTAEDETQKAEKGLIPLIRKVFRPSLTTPESVERPAITNAEPDEHKQSAQEGGGQTG